MISVDSIWRRVRDTLLIQDNPSSEPEELTREQFLAILEDVVRDFLDRTELLETIVVRPVIGGTVELPPQSPYARHVVFKGVLIDRATEGELVSLPVELSYEGDKPKQWSQDTTGAGRVLLTPSCEAELEMPATSSPLYGTISDTDLFTVTRPLYGTIGSWTAPVVSSMPMFGTVSSIGRGRSAAMVLAKLCSVPVSHVIYMIPEDFEQYLAWGVLAEVFTSSTAFVNPLKASVARARYEEGVSLALVYNIES